MSINIGSQLISKLGSPNSKIPLAAKDIFNTAGYTYFSYNAGGSIEGKDRLVDEVGTGLIWLFGIPIYKKLIDSTIYKLFKISPEIDFRVIKDNDYVKSAIENAPTEQIVKELKQAVKNSKTTKSLAILKFALSLLLTMLSYKALTTFKQKMTKKNIEKEFIENKQKNYRNQKISPLFEDIARFNDKNSKGISFGSNGIISIAEDFMINPVKNMVILDAGISVSRIKSARTKGEAIEYGIKEGSFLFFVYGAGKLISNVIDKLSEKFLNIPIKLDAKFLSSQTAEKLLTQTELQENTQAFAKMIKNCTTTKEIYDFIFENQNNIVVQAAKESGIIATIKDDLGKQKIDTRKYIDIKEIKKLAENLETFIEKSKDKDIFQYLKKVKNLKVASTILNVAVCCIFLGIIVPKAMYEYRKKHQDGKNDFHVKTQYEKELAKKYD